MAVSPAVRVGILVFLAALALVLVLGFLRGWTFSRNTYFVTAVCDNALGMIEGDLVRMAGVPIGDVEKLDLTKSQRAEMLLRINRKYRIPEGSRFVVRVGLLIGERYVEIVPNRKAEEFLKPGVRVVGEVPPRIEDLLPETEKLVKNLTTASEGLKEVLGDREFRDTFKQSVRNVEQATARLNAAMGAVETAVARNQDEIDEITANVVAASDSVRAMAAELEEFAAAGTVQEDVAESVRVARQTIESLERTVASLEKLVTAPEFQEDIRQTVAGARAGVEEAREVIGKVRGIFGGGGPKFKAKIPTRGVNLDMLYCVDDDRFRAELTTAIPTGREKFLELGLFDAGAGNKLILQPGQAIGPSTDLRYGLYASRLGIGLDHTFSSRTFGRLDAYDPFNPKLNLRAGYSVTDNWSLLLGVDELFDENQAVLGVKLRK